MSQSRVAVLKDPRTKANDILYVLRMHSVETSATGISLKELTSVLLDPEGEMILKAEKNIAFAINVTR